MKDLHDDMTQELFETTTVGKKRGRPAKHADAAARQKAYRERKKLEGMREVKSWVKDVRDDDQVLTSDIIDLSEVKATRFALLGTPRSGKDLLMPA